MAGNGPPPTPTAILKARGSSLVRNRKLEPELPAGTPDCPERLTGEALKYWDRHVPTLVDVGVITPQDGDAFARLCELHGRYVALASQVADDEKLHRQWSDVVDKLLRLEAHFGLTPSARTRIEAMPKPKEESSTAKYFGKPRIAKGKRA